MPAKQTPPPAEADAPAPMAQPVPIPAPETFTPVAVSEEELARRPFTASDSVANIFAAFVRLQTQNRLIAEFNRRNEGFKREGKPLGYADLTAVWEVLRPALASANLAVTQLAHNADRVVTVTTLVVHASGEWISSQFTMVSPDGTAHKLGSTITYCKRYALCTMLGVVADDDDDGNAGSGVDQPPRNQQRQQSQRSQGQQGGQGQPQEDSAQSSSVWVINSRDGKETVFANEKEWKDNWGSRIAAVLNSKQKDDKAKLETIIQIYTVNQAVFDAIKQATDGKAVKDIVGRLSDNKRRFEERLAAAPKDGATEGETKPEGEATE